VRVGIACFLSFFLFSFPFVFASEKTIDHSKWDRLLKAYVRPDGLVNYQGLLQMKAEIDDYVKQLEMISPQQLGESSREERLAFWINLYNASVVQMVLTEYPIERFSQIPAVFEVRKIQAANEFFSLSELRDNVLRQGFRDERVLTALVSARMDSPKLLPEAFDGVQIDEQLNRAAAEFVKDETRNQIRPGTKKIFLSPLFKNFASDFMLNFSSEKPSPGFSESEAAVISFVLYHLHDPDKRLFLSSGRYKINYLPEDSRLNDAGT